MPERDLVNVDGDEAATVVGQHQPVPALQVAVASATVLMAAETASRVVANEIAKGDVLGCARIAGIQAAKRTSELIPTALPVSIGGVKLEFHVRGDQIEIEATVEAFDSKGVSMQALTACSVAALTIYDMCKAIDRSMTVTAVAVIREHRGDATP